MSSLPQHTVPTAPTGKNITDLTVSIDMEAIGGIDIRLEKKGERKMKKVIFLVMAGILIISLSGCITATTTGALAGAGAGAVAGQAIGRNTTGTLIGLGLGGLAGALIGREVERR